MISTVISQGDERYCKKFFKHLYENKKNSVSIKSKNKYRYKLMFQYYAILLLIAYSKASTYFK